MISDLRTTERLGPVDPRMGLPPVRDREPHAVPDDRDALHGPSFDGIPATPPAEVLADIDAAFDRLHEIRSQGLELRYDVGDGMRIRIDLVDARGDVVRRVPPTEALELAVTVGPVPEADPHAAATDVLHVDREA